MKTTATVLLKVTMVGAAGLLVGACGAAPLDDQEADTDIGSTFEELGEASCATATAQTTVTGRVSNFTTSIVYSNARCSNAWVLDINGYDFRNSWTSVAWHDALNNPTDCGNAIVQAQLYVKQGASWVKQGSLRTSRGSWLAGPLLSFCFKPGTTWYSDTDLVLGKSYRIAGNAHYSGSTRTRALDFNSASSVVH